MHLFRNQSNSFGFRPPARRPGEQKETPHRRTPLPSFWRIPEQDLAPPLSGAVLIGVYWTVRQASCSNTHGMRFFKNQSNIGRKAIRHGCPDRTEKSGPRPDQRIPNKKIRTKDWTGQLRTDGQGNHSDQVIGRSFTKIK